MPFAPEAIPAAVALFRQTSAPLIRSEQGFHGMLTLANSETGHGFIATLWDTEEDLIASGVNDRFMQNLALYASQMTGSVSRDTYTVLGNSIVTRDDLDPYRPAYGRVTIASVRAGAWDLAYPALRDLAGWTGSHLNGWEGSLLLENRALRRVIVVEIWDTREHLDEADEPAFRFDSAARGANWLDGRPSREVFEVIARI